MRKLNKKELDYLNQCVILVDTREQMPLTFQHESKSATLKTGDYSIEGPDGRGFKVAIERKSIDDLVGSMMQGRDRFEDEFTRAQSLDYFALVIEASLTDIVNGFYHSKADPKAVVQSMISWSVRFGTPIWLADNRKFAARITESLLKKFVRGVLINEK